MGKKVFLSDVHISEGLSLGKENSFDWLSQEDRNLLASFFYNLAVDEEVDEVVLVGDIFDTWVFPIFPVAGKKGPSTIKDIMGAGCNKGIMDALSLLSQKKPAVYIPGNHDMTAWDPENKQIIGEKFKGTKFRFEEKYSASGIFAAHGHEYFVFNAADVIPGYKLPLGYYISRLAATLAAQGQPQLNMPQAIVRILGILKRGASGPDIVNSVINYLVERLNRIEGRKVDDNFEIPMSDIEVVTIKGVKERYKDMFAQWNNKLKRQKMPGEGVWDAIHKQVSGDSLNPNKCHQLIAEEKYKSVIFGHSHQKSNSYVCEKDLDSGNELAIGLSLNSGTWCSKEEHTYIEIDMDGRNHTVRIGDWSKRYGTKTTT